MTKPLKRNVSYMRISITDLCNMRCQYCMPAEGVTKRTHGELLSYEAIEKIVKAAVPLGIRKIRITGGEPMVRRGISDLVEKISRIHGIEEIAMTTNGTLLKQNARLLKEAGLKRFNISIDSLRQERYEAITRGGAVNRVLEGIEEVIALGMTPVKLNAVMIGGMNDDEAADFAALTVNRPIDVRFIELMPVGEASQWAERRFVSNEVIKKRLGLMVAEEEEAGSPAVYFRIPGAVGRVGFINPISHHFCGSCNRIRLTSDGRLKPCLHSDEEINLLPVLSESQESLTRLIEKAILLKPEKHNLEQHQLCTNRSMCQIGG